MILGKISSTLIQSISVQLGVPKTTSSVIFHPNFFVRVQQISTTTPPQTSPTPGGQLRLRRPALLPGSAAPLGVRGGGARAAAARRSAGGAPGLGADLAAVPADLGTLGGRTRRGDSGKRSTLGGKQIGMVYHYGILKYIHNMHPGFADFFGIVLIHHIISYMSIVRHKQALPVKALVPSRRQPPAAAPCRPGLPGRLLRTGRSASGGGRCDVRISIGHELINMGFTWFYKAFYLPTCYNYAKNVETNLWFPIFPWHYFWAKGRCTQSGVPYGTVSFLVCTVIMCCFNRMLQRLGLLVFAVFLGYGTRIL